MNSQQAVTLPGEPKTHGYTNAQAHVDSIVGAYSLVRACNGNFVDWDIVGPEGRDLLPELLWNDGDGTMVLREAAEQYCIDQPLSITEHGHRTSWSDGWETDHFEILLSTGGPHLHLEVTPDQLVRVIYQDWGTPEHSLPTTDDERGALAWFASLVCC